MSTVGPESLKAKMPEEASTEVEAESPSLSVTVAVIWMVLVAELRVTFSLILFVLF